MNEFGELKAYEFKLMMKIEYLFYLSLKVSEKEKLMNRDTLFIQYKIC